MQKQPKLRMLFLNLLSCVAGNMSPDQQEPTPFLIEWIPDILPISKIGELRIRFEFGHQRNGQPEKRTQRPLARAVPDISITRITNQHLLQL